MKNGHVLCILYDLLFLYRENKISESLFFNLVQPSKEEQEEA